MKLKAKLTKTVGWNNVSGNENITMDTEIDVADNIFDSITYSRPGKPKRKRIWYATLDGKLMLSHKGKSTYVSERKLRIGIYYMIDDVLRSVCSKYCDRNTNVQIDPETVIEQLKDEGRLVFHVVEIEQI